MVKILYIIGQLGKGGAERQLYELIKGLDKVKYYPCVISLSEGGYWSRELRKLDIQVIELQRKRNRDFNRLVKLIRLLIRLKPDIVHTFMFSGNTYGRIAAALNKVPVIIASERNLPEIGKDKNKYQVFVDRILSFVSDGIICNTNKAAKMLVEDYSFDCKKVFTVHNGMNINYFAKDAAIYERRSPLTKIIGTVGRLYPQKNHKLFLDMAAAILASSANNIYFQIVGKGELQKELEKYAEKLGIHKHVDFTGERSDIPELLNKMSVFVMTSSYEGMSNAIMEAMSARLPVVATEVGGNAEIIVDGETGFLCPKGDAKILGEKVLTLLNDEIMAREMGENGRKRILGEFGAEKMVDQTQNIYMKLLNNKLKFY